MKTLHVPLDGQQGNCWTVVVIYNENDGNDGDVDDDPLDRDDNLE